MVLPTLTTDLQAALEHAVGQVNNAFSQPIAQPKKKKRSRPTGDDEGGVEIDGQLLTRSETKKRKKRKVITVENANEGQGTAGVQGTGDTEPKKKKQKTKKQCKGGQPLPETIPVYTPQNPFDLQVASPTNPSASTAAFLSALVTAASETQPQTQPEYDQPQPQYLGYPPMGYPYNPNPQFEDPSTSSSQQPPLFSAPMGVPINDLASGSNEDILRAFQDLDMAKLANVLKSLGEAAAAANIHHQQQPGFLGGLSVNQGQTATPLNQVPTTAGDIMNPSAIEAKQQHQGKPGHNRVLDMSLPGPEHTNADHAYLLANKWMNAGKLSSMVREQGLVYKKGKFSAIEEQQLKDAIENYRIHKGLTPEQISELIFAKNDRGARDNVFWSEITSAVPQRPIIAVYHHVRRSYHPLKQQGKWMDTEDAALIQAVADLGQAWEKVSQRVGRMSSDCRDRYRNHIANRDIRITGAWKKEEEDELIRIVTEMTIHQGKDIDNDVFWGKVSQRMGNTRGRQQCRIKWTDSLSKTVKNEGQKPRWSQQDAYILVHKVDSLNVRDDTEIDWKTLPDPGWNLWSAHSLQRRWLTLKRSIKGFEEMTHQEIMDILRVKKAQLPAPAITPTKTRKITSAVTVADSECDVLPAAGSSTGPGTLTQAGRGDQGELNQDMESAPRVDA